MKDWIWKAVIALLAGVIVRELADASFRYGYDKALGNVQEIIEETIPESAPRVIIPESLRPKQKPPSTIRLVKDFIKSAKKSSVIRELVTNPEDHSAYAYVEDGMIKIEIRNRMDH